MLKYKNSLFLILFVISTPLLAESKTQNIPVQIEFEAKINGEIFDCNKSYNSVGITKSTLIPRDFRFYISNIKLLNSKGKEIPLQLLQDNKWQYKSVALLDFENNTANCEGNKEINKSIIGSIPIDKYKGLSFDLGIPFELNHQDVNLAPSPLNLTSLFWVWRSGYKFARLDFSSTGIQQGYFIHLGSTGCGEINEKTYESKRISKTPPLSCQNPNRAKINFPLFEIKKNKIIVDLGYLLSGSDINKNTPNTASGCMSGVNDPDCSPIFERLGLKNKSVTQNFFHLDTNEK